MRLWLSLFGLALFGLSLADESYDDLEKALKKFVEIVEENQLNVTLIATKGDCWAHGQAKEVRQNSFGMPTYNVQPTEATLTDEKIQEWLDAVKALNIESKAAARSRTAHIEDGETKSVDIKSDETDNLEPFETRLYKAITSVKYGEQGFVVDNPSYQTYYHVYLPGKGQKNERIEIIAGHVETEVLKKSDTITQEEINEFEQKLWETYYKYDCRKVSGRVLRDHMNNKFGNNDWQVILDPGDEFYVPAKKYVHVRAANSEALLYSM